MKKLLLLLLLVPVACFSQDVGRIRQGTSVIAEYRVLPDSTYDITVRNAHQVKSDIRIVFNDSAYVVRLGYWEKLQWTAQYPKGFSMYVTNLTYAGYPNMLECGSRRQVDRMKYSYVTKPLIIKLQCDEIPPVRDLPVRSDKLF